MMDSPQILIIIKQHLLPTNTNKCLESVLSTVSPLESMSYEQEIIHKMLLLSSPITEALKVKKSNQHKNHKSNHLSEATEEPPSVH